jgi:hypothetical protein
MKTPPLASSTRFDVEYVTQTSTFKLSQLTKDGCVQLFTFTMEDKRDMIPITIVVEFIDDLFAQMRMDCVEELGSTYPGRYVAEDVSYSNNEVLAGGFVRKPQ